MHYNFKEIENKWQAFWESQHTYQVTESTSKPKFYVLDMFPYPSGAGLHVGHPLGYIASDIYSRYKRLKGYNVLHPMGYDAYGLPAEQYAIQTGQHPATTTENNIKRYREQLDKIGFAFDWSREVRTSSPTYYHWTQWTFIKMFESYYDTKEQKAQPISKIIDHLQKYGTEGLTAAQSEELSFSAQTWNSMSEEQQQNTLLNYRIAYLGDTHVNWCPQLGTVLANDEVANGLSVRGGYPVEQRLMRQWNLRVSAYAERLLNGLQHLQWSEAMIETQRNWIGQSQGAEITFRVKDQENSLTIFTTRADTIFGATFVVLAPESTYTLEVTPPHRRDAVNSYIQQTKARTERERIADKKVSGVFSGAYAIHPITHQEIPIWIADYVLAGYGTGAVMAVPAHDSRDYAFAKHFDLPIIPLIEDADVSSESFDAKEGIMTNSHFLNGLEVKQAIETMKNYIVEHNLGRIKTNYRLRDAIFSRQRYWGEPFPVYYKNNLPYMIPTEALPLQLPSVDKYLPTESGQPPLGHATTWAWDTVNNCVVDTKQIDHQTIFPLELNTMPGFAGSSAYFIRYMDPHNQHELVSPKANKYWQNVDLYVGGAEHATGHLIYSRFWNQFLFDIGVVCKEEPFEKLINQGMIQGRSNFVYRINGTNTFVSKGQKDQYEHTAIHVDVNIVENDVLDIEQFKKWRPEFADAQFILEDGKYICGYAIEKMSKSMFNVVNPDQVIEKYGADTLRMYEMFLGPIEQSKPWDTHGIDGVHRFLRKLWNIFFPQETLAIVDEQPSLEELKSIHKLIKKVSSDIEQFSFNTSVAAFMICLNELSALQCRKKEIYSLFVVLLAPFAPHISEELWHALGHKGSVCDATWPTHNEDYLVESSINYTVSINGKARFQMQFSAEASKEEITKAILENPSTQKWIDGKEPKRVIVVPKKIVNIVV